MSARTSSVAPGERTRLPEDIGARRRIAEDLETTLFVQAAAGSGKTGALVARVVALIDGGRAELREIAAITFTEAAATELRTRVATALADPIASDAGGVVAGRRADALLQLDEAAMTTIHGFAQRLLTEHPIEAGLPLRFDVADERTASLVRQERFDAFIDTLFDDESARDLLGAAQILGVTPEHFRALSDQMSERFDPGERPSTPADGLRVVVRECVGTVREAGAECLDHRGGCPDPDDRLRVRLDRLAGALDDPLLDRADEDAWLGALAWLVALPGESRGKVGRATSWAPGRIEDAREALREYDEARAAGLAAVWDRVLGEIGGRLREEAARFADERRAVGSLFFSDLLVLGYEVLASSPAVREDARARYRYLLVDEFQDTDPLQFQMLTLLGGEGGTGALSGGRLFFVGDPMQSIYRFRGADVARYRAVRDAVGVDATVELTTNFRSAPEICTAVSEIFAKLVEGPDAATVRLRPFRQDDPRTRVWRIGHGDAERSVGERRAEEATAIVEALRALVDSGATVVDEGSARPVAYGDVAVLVPARTGMATLVRAFTLAGIDVRLTESALVYDAEEVADLVTVLRAIEDRGEESDVVAALRTAIFSISDPQLRAHVEAGGRWDLGLTSPPRGSKTDAGAPEIHAAFAVLRELRDARRLLGPVGTLLALIDRCRVREIAASAPGGVDALSRIAFLIGRARACEEAGGRTVADLLRFFALEKRLRVRVPDPELPGERPDAVRILTIHGAKGLEFPVVVLAELGRTIGERAKPPDLIVEGGRIEVALGEGRATRGYRSCADQSAAEDAAEALRVLYVGATRARDYLFICGAHRRSSSGATSLAALLEDVIDLPEAPRSPTDRAGSDARSRERDAVTPEMLERASAHWAAIAEASTRIAAVAPSALERTAVAGRGPRRGADPLIDGDDPGDDRGAGGIGWRRARAGTAIGRAVHGLLQRIDLTDPRDLEALAVRCAEREGCAEFAETVATRARAAVSSAIVRQAAANPRALRELPVTAVTGDGVLEGVVDLCFPTDGGWVIVDYKTDVVADVAEAEQRADRYRLQAGAYALALQGVTGAPVARVVLLFLAPPDGSIEVAIGDLPRAMADAADAIAADLAPQTLALGHDRSR